MENKKEKKGKTKGFKLTLFVNWKLLTNKFSFWRKKEKKEEGKKREKKNKINEKNLLG